MKGIPADQRSVRTIAKVGGLVGKVIEIDEKTRFRLDYVRMKIACRDVFKVPKTAESTLGLFLHDFTFEREVYEENKEKVLKSGIKVSESDQPPFKKFRSDEENTSHSHAETTELAGKKLSNVDCRKDERNNRNDKTYNSAPPKLVTNTKKW